MSNSKNQSVGLLGLLGLLFIGLKLGNVIDWSWWYVTMPFWVAPAIALIVFLLSLIISAIKKK